MDLVERVKAILLTPKTEWPVIAREPGDVAYLFKNYVAILAAIPAVCGFIGSVISGAPIVRALQAGVTVFCPGLNSMGFRSWCEDTVRALAEGVRGASEWTRPPVPESGFPD